MKALAIVLIATAVTLNISETSQNKTQNFVPAKIQNGILTPIVNLPMVNITANPQAKITSYTLPVVTITAPKESINMLPATKWNGNYIGTSQLSQVEITAKKKKTLLASFFRFN